MHFGGVQGPITPGDFAVFYLSPDSANCVGDRRSRSCSPSCCRMKFALVLISFLIAACSSLPSAKQDSLVGEWQYADNVQSCRYHFKKDGTFSGEVHLQPKTSLQIPGYLGRAGQFLFYRYLSMSWAGSGWHDRFEKSASGVEKRSFLIEAADGVSGVTSGSARRKKPSYGSEGLAIGKPREDKASL